MRSLPLRPLFIGLPGAGKTTLAREIAQRHSMDIVGTDPLFRVFRSIAASSDDPRAEVMRRFLRQVEGQHPTLFARIRQDAMTVDEKGRCLLHDSTRFRAYGEEVFRLFEIVMLHYLHETGVFQNKIVDLSASAPLFAQNRSLFSPANGYGVILLKTPTIQIVRNVAADYERYVRQTAEAGEKKPIRGAYEKKIDDALADTPAPVGSSQRQQIIEEAAAELTRQEEARRMAAYESFAEKILAPDPGTPAPRLADEAIALLHDIEAKRKSAPMPV